MAWVPSENEARKAMSPALLVASPLMAVKVLPSISSPVETISLDFEKIPLPSAKDPINTSLP